MKIYFETSDLVSFGEYLLSEERKNRIASGYKKEDPVHLDDRLKHVYHADIENWRESKQTIDETNR